MATNLTLLQPSEASGFGVQTKLTCCSQSHNLLFECFVCTIIYFVHICLSIMPAVMFCDVLWCSPVLLCFVFFCLGETATGNEILCNRKIVTSLLFRAPAVAVLGLWDECKVFSPPVPVKAFFFTLFRYARSSPESISTLCTPKHTFYICFKGCS